MSSLSEWGCSRPEAPLARGLSEPPYRRWLERHARSLLRDAPRTGRAWEMSLLAGQLPPKDSATEFWGDSCPYPKLGGVGSQVSKGPWLPLLPPGQVVTLLSKEVDSCQPTAQCGCWHRTREWDLRGLDHDLPGPGKRAARRAAEPNTTLLVRCWAPGVPPALPMHTQPPALVWSALPASVPGRGTFGKQRGRNQGSSILSHPRSFQNKGALSLRKASSVLQRPRWTAHLGEHGTESKTRSRTSSLLQTGDDCPWKRLL